jgi:proteasome lid subunit RPN8/RPN11
VTIRLNRVQIEAIGWHGATTYPEECCGIIIGYLGSSGKIGVELVPTENAWRTDTASFQMDSQLEASKKRRYAISPQNLLQAQKQARFQGLDIIGIYHSHPDYPATPSQFDLNCAWSNYSYIIASICQGTLSDIQSWCLDNKGEFQSEEILISES